MAARTLRIDAAQLRAAAEAVRRVTGLRVEIQAPPTFPPPRCGKHAGVVHHLAAAMRLGLPPDRTLVEGVGVELGPGDGPGFVVPDLTVCPAGFLDTEEAFLHPQDVELAVEVVAPAAQAGQVAEAVRWYAGAGIRALLVVDPRDGHGRWSLYSEPVSGHYWVVRRGEDEAVPLPEPFRPGEVQVARLPRYAPAPAPARRASAAPPSRRRR